MTDYLALAMAQDEEEEREELSADLEAEALPAAEYPSRGEKGETAPEKPRSGEEEPSIDGEEALVGGVFSSSIPLAEGLSRRRVEAFPEDRSQKESKEETGPSAMAGTGDRAPAWAGTEEIPAGLSQALTPAPPMPKAGSAPLPSLSAVGREELSGAAGVLFQLRRAEAGAGFAHRERRAFSVTLPPQSPAAPAWSVEELDRSCERDARRYGGGFGLY